MRKKLVDTRKSVKLFFVLERIPTGIIKVLVENFTTILTSRVAVVVCKPYNLV